MDSRRNTVDILAMHAARMAEITALEPELGAVKQAQQQQ